MSDHMDMNRFEAAIRASIRKEVDAIFDEEIKAAHQRVEDRIRGIVARTAIEVSQWAEVYMRDHRIIVEVKMPNSS